VHIFAQPSAIFSNARFREIALANESGPQLLGICFGHQAIGDALGGRVAANGRFVVGVDKLHPSEAFSKKPYVAQALKDLRMAQVPPEINLLESHGDAVHELPPSAELLASSNTTAVEMFTIEDRILGIQGHPEFYPQLVSDLILSHMVARGDIGSTEAAQVERSMNEEKLHQGFVRKLVQHFLLLRGSSGLLPTTV